MAEIKQFLSPEAEKQINDYINSLGKVVNMYDVIDKAESKASQSFTKNYQKAKEFEKTIGQRKTKVQELSKEQEWLNIKAKEAARINKNLATTSAKLTAAYSKENVRLQQKKKRLSEVNRTIKYQNVLNDQLAGTIEKLTAKNALLRRQVVKLDLSTKKGIETAKKLNKQIDRNDKIINKYSDSLKQRKINIGNYASALDGMGGTFGRIIAPIRAAGAALKTLFANPIGITIAAVAALGVVIGGLISNSKQFGVALSSLSAITGASGDELAYFSRKAKEMSSNSLLAADEVLTAFEKVGSIRPELLQDAQALAAVTEQAIILSETSGGKLPLEEAAKSLTFIMNQLELDTTEAAKATDILAAGQKYGSATVQDMSETYKNAGAVFKDTTKNLQESVVITQTVAKYNIIGAEAGTKLKSSIVNLQKANVGYISGQFNVVDALKESKIKYEELSTAQKKDAFIVDLFGKRNITVGKILLESTDTIEELTKKVDENGVALEQQARQNDNAAAWTKKAKTAWSNLLLTLSDGTGILGSLVKGGLKLVTAALNGLSSTVVTLKKYWGALVTVFKNNGWSDSLASAAKAVIKPFKDLYNAIGDTWGSIKKLFGKTKLGKQFKEAAKEQEEIIKKNKETAVKAEFEKDAAIEKYIKNKEAAEKAKAAADKKRDEEEKRRAKEKADRDKEELAIIKAKAKEAEAAAKRQTKKDINKLEKSKSTLSEKEYQDKIYEIRTAAIQSQIANLEKLKQEHGKKESEKLALQTKINDLLQQQDNLNTANEIKNQNRIKKITEALFAKKLSEEKLKAKQQENILKTQLARGVITEQEYYKAIDKLQEDAINKNLANLKKQIDSIEGVTEKKIKLEQKYNEIKQQLDDKATDNAVKNAEKEAERRKAISEKITEASIEAFNLISEAYFENQSIKREQELEQEKQKTEEQLNELKKRKDNGLITEAQYKAQKEKIEAAYAKKEGEAKVKQAKADRNKALFDIAISTAVGILKTTANMGLPAALPFIAIQAALGAVQAGVVLSKPLPKYAKGTDYSADTFIAGEAGREIIEHNGKITIAEKPTLFTGMKGSKVITNRETERLIQGAGKDAPDSDRRKSNEILEKIAKNTGRKQGIYINTRKKTITDRDGNYWKTYHEQITN